MDRVMANNESQKYSHILIVGLSLAILFFYFIFETSLQDFTAIASNSDTKSNTQIKHIIVVSQGRRSFDNYFGTFPGANGLPENLTIPFNPFPPTIQKFTVETWFKTNNTFQTNAFLVNKGGVGSDIPGYNMNYGIWMNNIGNIAAGFETKEGVDYTVQSTNSFNDGKWHQVFVTYDGNSNLKLYMDGDETAGIKTEGQSPDTTGTKTIRVGANSFQPEYFFTGYIDDVRIWNRTLDHTEILNGYNNNVYDSDRLIVYSPFENKESFHKNSTNIQPRPTSTGIFLNGSSYEDLKLNISKFTSYLKPFILTKTKTDSPNYGANAYDLSYNNGQMNGFVIAQYLDNKDPKLVMGHYNGNNLRFYWKFATEYVLADNFFASTMDTGFENENYLYTGIPVDKNNDISFNHLTNLNRTIFDQLQKGGVPWKIYVDDYNPVLNQTEGSLKKNRFINLLTQTPRFHDNRTLNSKIVDLDYYFKDLRNDNFPSVAYIVAPNNEENSPRDVTVGEEFVASLVLALMESKHWNDSAIIITYRESGGWYDHVPPPKVGNDIYGFRVPSLIISPYAKRGYIDSTFYDASSVLKFIEYNYNISSIGNRDANANNMLQAFDFSKKPRAPINLKSGYIDSLNQDIQKNIEKSTSVKIVNSIYQLSLLTLGIVSLLVAYTFYRKKNRKRAFEGHKNV